MPAPTVIPKETRRDAVIALYTHEDGQQADGAPEEQPPTRVLFAARPAVILEDIHRELRSFAACDPRGRLVVSPCHGLHPARRHSFQALCSSAPCLSCGLACRWASPTWATRPPR